MPPFDPYQKSFSTVEELLSNPRGRVRQNPSKAYETIVAAVKSSGGWSVKKYNATSYVIISGPLTGTYTLGQATGMDQEGHALNRYEPTFELGGRDSASLKDKFDKLMNKLHPVYAAVVGSGMFPGDYKDAYYKNHHTVRETWFHLRQLAALAEDDHDPPPADGWTRPRVQRALIDYNADPEGYTKQHNEIREIPEMANTHVFVTAEKLYILSQAGSVPVSTVVQEVEAKPQRLLSLNDVRIPTRLSDRTRYAAEFLRTWSAQKATKRILPNVEGAIPSGVTELQSPQDIRSLLNYVPSWRQMAQSGKYADRLKAQSYNYAGSDKPTKERLTEGWIYEMGYHMRRFQKEGVSPAVFREQLLQKYDSPQLSLLEDALAAVRRGAPILVQTPEGRLLVRAREEKDWPRLLRGHDQAVAAAHQAQEQRVNSAQALADAEKFKRGASQFNMIPGVRPLITKAEYKCEGDEMVHCVHSMGYYLKRDGYEFAFAAPDGTRATLELDANNGRVRQLFGPGDSTPSAATQEMLGRFLAVNDDNIALLKKGKFPLYSKGKQ